jgi:hypothetical protein
MVNNETPRKSLSKNDDGDIEEVLITSTSVAPSANGRISKKGSSMSTGSDDPFAPREGKTLVWRNVNMTLVSLRPKCSSQTKCHDRPYAFCCLLSCIDVHNNISERKEIW